ncbi:magnesium and cobalt transport protein CorA [Nocardiopsis sp. ATB16-24]|uniref:magnesium and cobalt transport protein CorA n=1 Tax=Nocardiopsis sp. ATB16-24 TaxID=3019555 RepID=UPI00255526BE|nr:magnesium and cobalt transport protein CorA [Nocardiopsis sp. ATB16-24]
MPDSSPERLMALGHRQAEPSEQGRPGRVRCVLYRDGRREGEVATVAEARRAVEEAPGSLTWISMSMPDHEQIFEAARVFDLPELAVEDAIVAHQRPKAEAYGGVLFLVLRPARYDEERESVDVGEVHVFVGHDFVITIGHTDQVDFEDVRALVEADPDTLAHGVLSVVYTILDRVVDAYAPVIAGIQQDIDEVEGQVFARDPKASPRIYRLAREVIALARAVDPLEVVLEALMEPLTKDTGPPGQTGAGSPAVSAARPFHIPEHQRTALHHRLRDVADHAAAVHERLDGSRQLLQNIMALNSALVDQAQNEAMKKVSSWGGILIVPTLIVSVYAVDIEPQPGFHWVFSWTVVLATLVLSSLCLYLLFRYKGWL